MEVTKVPKKIVTVIEPKRSMTVDKEKYRQKRVAAYCRVSTDSEEQLVSYANQKKVYTEMIASRKDWCFAGLFADEGKSGTRADKRPEFNKMINDCLAGKIDYIITKSVSRFARNTVDCLDYVRMLKSKGIGVYFEEQQIDTLKTDSELYLVIYAGFAQSESESISKNITWSVRKKFEDGAPVFMYKRFLGYRKGADGEPEIVPSEAVIVERIFNLYLAGETVDKISKMMQAENYDIPGKTISFSKGMIMNKLIERFPFLIPRNRWTGKVPEDYDYSYTELDSMPDGWRKAFGEQMCEDIREELVRAEYLDQYRITQIKEKYGTLCWYDFGCTERMLRDIIPKYEHLSARTCIRCGNPATKVSTGWISPYCDTCAGKISHAERFISIEEWLDRSSSEVTSKRSLNEKDTHSL